MISRKWDLKEDQEALMSDDKMDSQLVEERR